MLEEQLHFRSNQSCDDYFQWIAGQVPWYFHLSKITPAIVIKKMMETIANRPGLGTQRWIKNKNQDRITAYFTSFESWKSIPGWDQISTERPSESPTYLDHGYDESKPKSALDIEDMRKAAGFRGGRCISATMRTGDLTTPLEWECQFGHRFTASPSLVLLGGHWCPECLPLPWNYDKIAQGNPFFAQVWHPFHTQEEQYTYDESIFSDFKE